MIFYGVSNFRLQKHQVQHVLKAHLEYSPYAFYHSTEKPKIYFALQIRTTHMQYHLTDNFQPPVVLKPVHINNHHLPMRYKETRV